jgi:hypothetical protein
MTVTVLSGRRGLPLDEGRGSQDRREWHPQLVTEEPDERSFVRLASSATVLARSADAVAASSCWACSSSCALLARSSRSVRRCAYSAAFDRPTSAISAIAVAAKITMPTVPTPASVKRGSTKK